MKLKKYHVWRKKGESYNGYEEVWAFSPEEAEDTVFNWDWEDGQRYNTYEVYDAAEDADGFCWYDHENEAVEVEP